VGDVIFSQMNGLRTSVCCFMTLPDAYQTLTLTLQAATRHL